MTDCTKTVGLRFPYSTSINDEPQIFKISYNTALKSNFIEVLLENENNSEHEDKDENTKGYIEYTIPKNLYKGIRHKDINKMFEMWKGNETYLGCGNNRYCYDDIARLTQALLLDKNMYFVTLLEEQYPPNCVKHVIREQEREHLQQLTDLQNELQNLRSQIYNVEPPPNPTIIPLTLEELS